MAGADVIGTAICIALLVIVAYVVAGSILTTSGIVIGAQNDMTLSQQERLETSVSAQETHWHNCRTGHCENPNEAGGTWICDQLWKNVTHFWILNTGDQTISDLDHIDVILTWAPSTNQMPVLYTSGSGTEGTKTYFRVGIYKDISNAIFDPATPEDFNIGMWDPGEYLSGRIEVGIPPNYISVVLPNGVEVTTGDISWADVYC